MNSSNKLPDRSLSNKCERTWQVQWLKLRNLCAVWAILYRTWLHLPQSAQLSQDNVSSVEYCSCQFILLPKSPWKVGHWVTVTFHSAECGTALTDTLVCLTSQPTALVHWSCWDINFIYATYPT